MSNIQPFYLHQAGPLPGLAGIFAGGQTVYVDMSTMRVVQQSPILQRPMHEQPLVEATPVQPEQAQRDGDTASESEKN